MAKTKPAKAFQRFGLSDEHLVFGYTPTVNDAAMNAIVREVGEAELGAENVVFPHDIVMWAEDMSYMLEERPGSYFIVGARGEKLGTFPQHCAQYDIDEKCLEVGFKMMVGLGLRP